MTRKMGERETKINEKNKEKGINRIRKTRQSVPITDINDEKRKREENKQGNVIEKDKIDLRKTYRQP